MGPIGDFLESGKISGISFNTPRITFLTELTSPLFKGTFEDDFPFSRVGYVSSLEGKNPSINGN